MTAIDRQVTVLSSDPEGLIELYVELGHQVVGGSDDETLVARPDGTTIRVRPLG